MARPGIWWWQRIVSPHMAGLAAALAAKGCEVTYVAEQPMSASRARDGWQTPHLRGVRLELMPSRRAVRDLARAAPADSIHICQGIRANGRVGQAQAELARRGLRQWAVMETVDDAGWMGALKRLEYRRLFRRWGPVLEGVLATGHRTPAWVADRGAPADRVFPFAYFLSQPDVNSDVAARTEDAFRFVYAGQLIALKRIVLLMEALAAVGRTDLELVIVGDGPLRGALQSAAARLLPGRVHWLGRRPMGEVPAHFAAAECLVLPSRHDGWGAVVSEALMVGTPAICSEACGSAGVVRASGEGGVFPAGDVASLTRVLQRVMEAGRVGAERRQRLASWARCLDASTGAEYLLDILDHRYGTGGRPAPPWVRSAPTCVA